MPSGTELQLIERHGALAKVRTAAGAEGWVDSNFISESQPARARIQAMENELAGAQAALADLQAKVVIMEQRPQPAATEGAGEEQSAQLPSEALREMQLLAEENQRLKQQVAELEAVHRMAQERTAGEAVTNDTLDQPIQTTSNIDDIDDIVNIAKLQQWHLILLASVLLLAFSTGGWLVDWGMRRRHGGFRV